MLPPRQRGFLLFLSTLPDLALYARKVWSLTKASIGLMIWKKASYLLVRSSRLKILLTLLKQLKKTITKLIKLGLAHDCLTFLHKEVANSSVMSTIASSHTLISVVWLLYATSVHWLSWFSSTEVEILSLWTSASTTSNASSGIDSDWTLCESLTKVELSSSHPISIDASSATGVESPSSSLTLLI